MLPVPLLLAQTNKSNFHNVFEILKMHP